MSVYDVLSRLSTRAALRVTALVMVALLLRLVAVPLALVALLTARLVAVVDTALTVRPTTPASPPCPPRWSAANTRTRTYATV